MKILNTFNEKFDNFYDYIGGNFVKLLLFFHVIYFIILLNIISFNSEYINLFYNLTNVLLCLFLIIRFNPLREKYELRTNDPKLIFSISFFLLLNMFVVEIIKNFYPSKYDSIKKHASA